MKEYSLEAKFKWKISIEILLLVQINISMYIGDQFHFVIVFAMKYIYIYVYYLNAYTFDRKYKFKFPWRYMNGLAAKVLFFYPFFLFYFLKKKIFFLSLWSILICLRVLTVKMHCVSDKYHENIIITVICAHMNFKNIKVKKYKKKKGIKIKRKFHITLHSIYYNLFIYIFFFINLTATKPSLTDNKTIGSMQFHFYIKLLS